MTVLVVHSSNHVPELGGLLGVVRRHNCRLTHVGGGHIEVHALTPEDQRALAEHLRECAHLVPAGWRVEVIFEQVATPPPTGRIEPATEAFVERIRGDR